MAKKIIIDFSAQPITTGIGFNYSIQIGIFNVVYSNGSNECIVNFIPSGGTIVNDYDLPIGADLAETLDITLNFLRNYYAYSLISYNIVGNTIEALIQADAIVTIDASINSSIEITSIDVEPTFSNIIYYLYFDDYILNIYKNNYQGTATEIYGSFSIKKNTVDSVLDSIRGTALQISLEGDSALNFDEFLLNDEFTYKTELIKSGVIIFEGYIKPDGIQQSYINDLWLVNIESTDGLGALKDLSFVQPNGLSFTGKLSVYDVIKGCLDRTRLSLTINTCVNIEYSGYLGNNILKDIFVNSERFIKDKDDSVLMDCNEVITSMLDLFSAVITQQDGKWWIYRPNDLDYNGSATFINQETNVSFLYNFNKNLGSQINGFFPHHCNSDQQIEVKGAISGYRVNYQYGFIDGFVKNPTLNHNSSMVFTDWTTNPALPIPNIEIINDGSLSGLKMIIKEGSPQIDVLTSSAVSVTANSQLTLRVEVSTEKTGGLFTGTDVQFIFKIIRSDGYYLSDDEWVLSDEFLRVKTIAVQYVQTFTTFELEMPIIPVDCTITVKICEVRLALDSSMITANVNKVQILDNSLKKQGIVGEFHTVTRFSPPSSITKENQKVFNGDGGNILIGSIFKENKITLTDYWNRKNSLEQLPLLGISAMDDLRIQASPIKVFSGSILGYIPYMSVVKIDKINGFFMFIEYDYDIKTNVISAKLLQFYNSDLADIQYTISPDYGKSTIKPTIKG